MRIRKLAYLALIASCLACSGCSAIGNYFGNRGNDLADIFTLELTGGPGIDVHFQATALLGTVVGISEQEGLMWHGRFFGRGKRISQGTLLEAGTHTGRTLHGRMKPLYGEQPYQTRGNSWLMCFAVGERPEAEYKFHWQRALDVEVGASVILGVHVGFSPIELIDCVTSIFFLDLAGDDYHPEPLPEESF